MGHKELLTQPLEMSLSNKRVQKKAVLTQKELAARLEVERNTVWRWETSLNNKLV